MRTPIYMFCVLALFMSVAIAPQAQTVTQTSGQGDTTEVSKPATEQGNSDPGKPGTGKTATSENTAGELNFLQWLIAFSPILLFLLLFFTMLKGLGKDFFSQATREKTGPAAVRAADNNEPAPASTSRFVLMLAGISAVITGLSMTTYFFYFKMTCVSRTCPDPDFSNLTNVLLALGIGVVPYTMRKLANN